MTDGLAFKLDRIGPLNQLDRDLKRAHDASADVAVTARLARQLALYDADFFSSCLQRIDKHFVTDQIRADGRGEGLLEVTPYAGGSKDLRVIFGYHFDCLSVQMTMLRLISEMSQKRL